MDKTVTFNFEEALLSARSFAVLSGGNLTENSRVNMHVTERVEVTKASVELGSGAPVEVSVLDLTPYLPDNGQILSAADSTLVTASGAAKYPEANIFVMELDEGGEIVRSFDVTAGALTAAPTTPGLSTIALSKKAEDSQLDVTDKFYLASAYNEGSTTTAIAGSNGLDDSKMYLIDFYISQPGSNLTITPGKFAGNFLIEANTLFRRQSDSLDFPAQFTIPNGKISTNFTFSMASTGDPSTFPFAVEAFSDYLPFNKKCKALFALDIADEPVAGSEC